MDFTTFKKRVYRAVQDDPDAPFRFNDDRVAEGATEAFKEYVRKCGKNSIRILLSLVQSSRSYALPADVGRVSTVWIIPENSLSEPPPLIEVDALVIKVTSTTEADPQQYAISNSEVDGVVSLILDPPPARSTANAIVVEYDVNDIITSSTVQMPFPDSFNQAFVWLTAAHMLFDMDDETSLQKAQLFENKGIEKLSVESVQGSILKSRNILPRMMP